MTKEALRAYEHAQESDATAEEAEEQLREAVENTTWDFDAMPDVEVGDE